MSQEDGEEFMALLNGEPVVGAAATKAVPDDQFDDSFDQIRQDIG